VTVTLNEPLSKHTTFRIGGPAGALVTAKTVAGLKAALDFARCNDVRWKVFGAGSNLLVSGQGYPGMVIKLGSGFSGIELEPPPAAGRQPSATLKVGAATLLSHVVDFAAAKSLTGAEFLWGIPGTLGGGLRNNAGAFGHELAELLVDLEGMTPDGKEVTLARKDIKFRYRGSELAPDMVLVAGRLRLKLGEKAEILARIEEHKRQRNETQPKGPSAGSVFRNPKDASAGKLIEAAGLKGRHLGDAVVSERHANFILNKGMALFGDVYQLIELIKLKVEEKSGVVLEEEIEIVADGVPLSATRLQPVTGARQ
jgi:UDP-N-acetylmuramate dehydrogenase